MVECEFKRPFWRLLMIVVAWCLWSGSAQAQYPCAGAGPGERIVGMSQGGNGIAPVPLCVRDEAAPASAPPPTPSDSYAAMAWHPDAADVWVDGNYIYSAAAAETQVLAACNRAMGGGCSAAGTWWNSSMTVIRDASGYFYKGWAGEGGAERKRVLAECSAKQMLPCQIFATIRSGTNQRLPNARTVRKSFAAASWVVGGRANGYDGKLYVASGYGTADEATAAAIKACDKAKSVKCESVALTGNGFIQTYRTDNGTDNVIIETSAQRAKEAARIYCKRNGSRICEMQEQFDAHTPGLFVHIFDRGTGQ